MYLAMNCIMIEDQILELAMILDDGTDDLKIFNTVIKLCWVQGPPMVLNKYSDLLGNLDKGIAFNDLDLKIEEFLDEFDYDLLVVGEQRLSYFEDYSFLDIRSLFWDHKKDGLSLPSLKICGQRAKSEKHPKTALSGAFTIVDCVRSKLC